MQCVAKVVIPFLLSVPSRVKTNVFSEKGPSWYSYAQAMFEREHCGNGRSSNLKPLSLNFAFHLWAASSRGCVHSRTPGDAVWVTRSNPGAALPSLPWAVHRHVLPALCAVLFIPLTLCSITVTPQTYGGSRIRGVPFIRRQKRFIKISIALNKRNICWPY